jgi:hypothetical protein
MQVSKSAVGTFVPFPFVVHSYNITPSPRQSVDSQKAQVMGGQLGSGTMRHVYATTSTGA